MVVILSKEQNIELIFGAARQKWFIIYVKLEQIDLNELLHVNNELAKVDSICSELQSSLVFKQFVT
jgi:flagellin-specific chaperone FliS